MDPDRPIDPRALRDAFDALLERVTSLERQLDEANERITTLEQRKLTLDDLPLAALVRWLEQHGGLDIALAAYPGSVTRALRAEEERAGEQSPSREG